MNKAIKYLIGLKVALLAAAGGYYYYNTKLKAKEPVAKKAEPPPADSLEVGDYVVPNIPKGNLTVTDAVRVRDELEVLRKDVLAKITKLGEAKQSYDTAKVDVEAKLKAIRDERRVLDETLQKEKLVQADRLKEALEFVGKMEPKKAAAVLENTDRDLVLQMLRKLPQRQVTKILENLPPKKASEYMEYYTKIRSGREYELMKELGLCNNPTQPDSPQPASNAPQTNPNGVKAEAASAEQKSSTVTSQPSSAQNAAAAALPSATTPPPPATNPATTTAAAAPSTAAPQAK